MSKLSNCLVMMELLSTGRKYSVLELAKIIEVTPRMIRIYKDDLEKAGIYVDVIRGPYGGYVLNTDYNLVTPGFSKYDIQMLEDLYDRVNISTEIKEEYNTLVSKIKNVYKSSKKKIDFSVNNLNGDDKFNVLKFCIRKREKLLISFMNLDGSLTERIIHPANLFIYGDEWYIAAFCELRNEIRHFKLERIKKFQLLNERYID